MGPRHLPQLDSLRGLSIVLVVLGHWLANGPGFEAIAPYAASIAQLGVLLFFLLSGFLITRLLVAEQAQLHTICLRKFYVRRLLRLMPAFLIFVSVCFLLSRLGLIIDVPQYEFAVTMLYLRNIFGRSHSLGHLWSLSLEEQFYLIWPLIFKRIPQTILLPLSLGAVIVAMSARAIGIVWEWYPYHSGVFYVRPWFRFDSILAGCCLALPLRRDGYLGETVSRVLRPFRGVPNSVYLVALVTWSLFGEGWAPWCFITVQLLLGVTLTQRAIEMNPLNLGMIFGSPILRYCGRISYSWYLWQQLFLVTKDVPWGVARAFPLNLLFPLLIAICSYHFVEQPFLKLKVRFQTV